MPRTYVNSNIKLKTSGGLANSATDGLSADTGTTANKIVQLDPSAKIPVLDGSQLILVAREMIASNDIRVSNDGEISKVSDQNYTLAKTIVVNIGGTYRVTFDTKGNANGGSIAKIYRNGVAIGTERSGDSSYQTFSEDIVLAAGDRVQLYYKCATYNATIYVRNFRVSGMLSSSLTYGFTE